VWEALSRITDPEMPVSLVDMGMVYRVAVEEGTAEIDLTFTSIGCPAMDMILGDVREAVAAIPGIDRVELEVVWSPPWTKDRLTTRGRTLLSAYGLAL
jgi:phenylacetate-CoA oxygenase PaaJ subunit